MSLLVYRRPCEHGHTHFHTIDGTHSPCDGKIDIPLDPDKVLERVDLRDFAGSVVEVTTRDVLDVLDREGT